MPIKIEAGVVVTINPRMEVWRPGHVVIADGKIVAAAGGSGPEGDFEEVMQAPDCILMPGLVNAHAHSPSNLVKGTWSQLPLEIWRQYIRAAWREYSERGDLRQRPARRARNASDRLHLRARPFLYRLAESAHGSAAGRARDGGRRNARSLGAHRVGPRL